LRYEEMFFAFFVHHGDNRHAGHGGGGLLS